MTLSRFAALAIAGAALTGCISTEPIPTQDYGFVVLVGESDGAGGHTIADPLAYFLRTSRIGISEAGATRDNCEIGAIPPSSDPVPGLPYLDAGSQVTVVTTGSPFNLPKVTAPNSILYKLTGSFGLTPGGSVSASVPGADGGFPAMAVTGTAATSFTFSEIPVGEGINDIDLTWTAPPQAGRTSMNVSLRYADDSQTLNQQIFCSLVDDGSYTVEPLLADRWLNADADLREAHFERVRIELEADADTKSTLVIFSTYLQNEPTPPAP